MSVPNTDATMYKSLIVNVATLFNCKFLKMSCMPNSVSAGPPEASQRNACNSHGSSSRSDRSCCHLPKRPGTCVLST